MIILDFLFYYLTLWFEEHKDKLKWSTPLERSIYVMGLVTCLWLFSIWELIEIFILKPVILRHLPEIPFVILSLAIMQLYKYIYFTKKRYELISSSKYNFGGNKKVGKVLSIIFVFFSFTLPYILFMIYS
jgi:hypothetical protein